MSASKSASIPSQNSMTTQASLCPNPPRLAARALPLGAARYS